MRTILHLSDLHFGAAAPELVEAVLHHARAAEPDVVAISGDLTQRARTGQFRRARAFLDALPAPRVVVPGNHDVPLYNLLARFGDPLGAFRRHITAERHPLVTDSEIAVIGADTTRSFTIKDGGLRCADVRCLSSVLCGLPRGVVKVVVCHHPFDAPIRRLHHWTRPAADASAVNTLVGSGADIFLTGHLHLSYAGHTAARYQVAGRSAIVVEAGTATSIRSRGHANAFNLVRVDGDAVTVERREWDASARGFTVAARDGFRRMDDGWVPSGAREERTCQSK